MNDAFYQAFQMFKELEFRLLYQLSLMMSIICPLPGSPYQGNAPQAVG